MKEMILCAKNGDLEKDLSMELYPELSKCRDLKEAFLNVCAITTNIRNQTGIKLPLVEKKDNDSIRISWLEHAPICRLRENNVTMILGEYQKDFDTNDPNYISNVTKELAECINFEMMRGD